MCYSRINSPRSSNVRLSYCHYVNVVTATRGQKIEYRGSVLFSKCFYLYPLDNVSRWTCRPVWTRAVKWRCRKKQTPELAVVVDNELLAVRIPLKGNIFVRKMFLLNKLHKLCYSTPLYRDAILLRGYERLVYLVATGKNSNNSIISDTNS